jgi:hypothetical protein
MTRIWGDGTRWVIRKSVFGWILWPPYLADLPFLAPAPKKRHKVQAFDSFEDARAAFAAGEEP